MSDLDDLHSAREALTEALREYGIDPRVREAVVEHVERIARREFPKLFDDEHPCGAFCALMAVLVDEKLRVEAFEAAQGKREK